MNDEPKRSAEDDRREKEAEALRIAEEELKAQQAKQEPPKKAVSTKK